METNTDGSLAKDIGDSPNSLEPHPMVRKWGDIGNQHVVGPWNDSIRYEPLFCQIYSEMLSELVANASFE